MRKRHVAALRKQPSNSTMGNLGANAAWEHADQTIAMPGNSGFVGLSQETEGQHTPC